MGSHNVRLAYLIVCFLCLSGCWDQREIEDIGLVLAVGIDRPLSKEEKGTISNRFAITHHMIVPKGMASKDGGEEKPYINIINEGETIFESIRSLATRIGRPPNYQHLKVIVISQEIARTVDLREVSNFYLRNPESRRTVIVLISSDLARGALNVDPPLIFDPGMALMEVSENNQRKTMRIAPSADLGTLSEKMAAGSSFIIPRVVSTKKDIKVAGGAVIKGDHYKMIGWLGEEEIEGINWVTGKGRGGIVKGIDPVTQKVMVYEIRGVKRKITPSVKGDKLSFVVQIDTEGSLREDFVLPKGDGFEKEFIKRAEEAAEEEIKKKIMKALEKTQKNFKVDVAGFGKQVHIHYPELWKKWKPEWEERFSQTTVEIRVEVRIREVGTKGAKM